MKLKSILLLLLVSSNLIFSQEKVTRPNSNGTSNVTPKIASPNGTIQNGIYSCLKFNWKIQIPENYPLDAATVVLPNGTVISQNPSHLVGFGIDGRNTFLASLEPLAGSNIKSLEDHKEFMIQLYNDTYSKIETLKFELSSSNMKIGNYDFYKIQTKLYDPKTKELLLTQDLYNSFVNDHLFSVNINYNHQNVGKFLTDNFIGSLSN